MTGSTRMCPKCGAPMRLRTAGRGENAGGQFWGCSQYPRCKATMDASGSTEAVAERRADQPSAVSGTSVETGRPTRWTDRGALPGYESSYVSIGARPGWLTVRRAEDEEVIAKLLSQTRILRRRRSTKALPEMQWIASVLTKILHRGQIPWVTTGVEQATIRAHGLTEHLEDLGPEEIELGWRIPGGARRKGNAEALTRGLTVRDPFRLATKATDAEEATDSVREERFLTEWVREKLGPSAGHWIIPQAPMNAFERAAGGDGTSAQRVDFVFSHPAVKPFVVELDGAEHERDADVDRNRDAVLKRAGVDVIRVPNDEVDRGDGPHLREIEERWTPARTYGTGAESAWSKAVEDCAWAAKLQYCLARAMASGWLAPHEPWAIELSPGTGPAVTEGIADLLRLLEALGTIYDVRVLPEFVTVRCAPDLHTRYDRTGAYEWSADAVEANTDFEPTVGIKLERRGSPHHEGEGDESRLWDFVVQPAYLPVTLEQRLPSADELREPASAEAEGAPDSAKVRALEICLQQIFRKQSFRAGQAAAVLKAMKGEDCVVLLPTGAGKSIVYQLAGMLRPGITLTVDPIIALIDDQIEGLKRYGIDYSIGLSSQMGSDAVKTGMEHIARGNAHFVFCAPERLQNPGFRETLRTLTYRTPIGLAVIDEAHCISEWGHDFRPSYLKLESTLRGLSRGDGASPAPLMALTGTASRAVMRDMLAALKIDTSKTGSVVRPESFDRSEIGFDIIRLRKTQKRSPALQAALDRIAESLDTSTETMGRPAGPHTAAGIVFVPHVNGEQGLEETASHARAVLGPNVGIYAGSAPKGTDWRTWAIRKQEEARRFKENETAALIATKAFGMGIDKPNIRYIVHYGMPTSLEAFYQEVGRAGRDRKHAESVVIFSEYDEQRSEHLLDGTLDTETARQRYQQSDGSERDDVRNGLFFHYNAFPPRAEAYLEARMLIERLEGFDDAHEAYIGYTDDDERKGIEHGLHRLNVLGAVSDYTVDAGAKRIQASVERTSLAQAKDHLLRYVEQVQPARRRVIEAEIEPIEEEAAEWMKQLTEVLIDFAYEHIERARRRMFHEAVLLARQAIDGEEIRARVLDYLQEGIGAQGIEKLTQREVIDFEEWAGCLDKVQSTLEAGELRGTCIRALESEATHPGLLMLRGIIEMLCDNADRDTAEQAINEALVQARERYGLTETEQESLLLQCTKMARSRAPGLAPVLGMIVTGQGTDDDRWTTASNDILDLAHPEMGPIRALRAVQGLVGQAMRGAQHMDERNRRWTARIGES